MKIAAKHTVEAKAAAKATGFSQRHAGRLLDEKRITPKNAAAVGKSRLDLAAEKLLKLRAEREMAEIDLAKARGDTLAVSTLVPEMAKFAAELRAAWLLILRDRIPVECAGKSAEEIREVTTKVFNDLCAEMQRKGGAWAL